MMWLTGATALAVVLQNARDYVLLVASVSPFLLFPAALSLVSRAHAYIKSHLKRRTSINLQTCLGNL